ncbi:MAG: 2,3-bisphosphoglycerate-independent phosphoglycerate mutase [Patescibacteria group bacterium]|nr:2,3-bisphosphoglycerate-independent phosphoglycerate mutase [Patescibacteria group bacterium]
MEKKPVILIVLDGYGMAATTEGNAVFSAKTPVFDTLIKKYPTGLLTASGTEVGLDWGEMGNSEVGHLNLGSGRVVLQDFSRINKSITDGSFFENEALLEIANHVKKSKSTLHLMGLLSNGGVHAHIDHIKALLDFCNQQKISRVALHLFTDGRDTAPKIAQHLLDIVQEKINKVGNSNWKIASLIGRFYAMDRDKHWERIVKAYDLITQGKGEKFTSYKDAIDSAYKNKNFDEELPASIIEPNYMLSDNDGLIFFNFRRDRAKQIAQTLIDPNFKDFARQKIIKNLFFVGFVNYGQEANFKVKIAFFNEKIKNQLADVLGKNKFSHLHIAETEKYAHVTYFFNGGEEKPFLGEERILVPSPRVTSYAQIPQMSAKMVTEKLLAYIKKNRPDFTVLNFANPDMVGHTGNFAATVSAIEFIDQCLKKILTTIYQIHPDTSLLITADHGNAEQMINPETKSIDKEHTTNPVPFICIENVSDLVNIEKFAEDKDAKLNIAAQSSTGILADVTTTILDLNGLKKTSEMTGISLKGRI